MKHLFGIFIPLCICSFIAFGISVAVKGVPETMAVSSDIVSDGYTEAAGDTWTRVLEGDYTNIKIDTGAIDLVLTPADVSETIVKFTAKDYKGNITTEIDGSTLKIEADEYFAFHGVSELIKRITDGIKNNFVFDFSTARLDVTVPQQVYDKLDISMGSGSVTVDGMQALVNDIEIGSGGFYYTGVDGFTADKMNVDLGSGHFSLKNAATQRYDINVGSGSFDVSGLSGSGVIDMGSGKGTIRYGEVNGNSVLDVSSGSLNIVIPSDASAVIKADIGSGSIRVNACGVSANLNDGQKATLNGGKYEIKAELGSGSIKFTDSVTSEPNVGTAEEAAYEEVVIFSSAEAEAVEVTEM